MSNIELNSLNKNYLYYFASPYSHKDPYVRERRYLDTIKVATDLILDGFTLLEPIAMSHHHAQRFGLPSGYEFWQTRDRKFIEKCDAVLVLMIDGWEESVGVTDEIAHAYSLNIPVYYIKDSDIYSDCVIDEQGVTANDKYWVYEGLGNKL